MEVVCSDLDCIMAQVCSYREDIEYCSSEIKKEYDIEQIFSKNWPKLIQDTIDSYEFQLGEAIDQMTGE